MRPKENAEQTEDANEARMDRLIGQTLRNYDASDFNAAALAGSMAREMDRGKTSPAFPGGFRRIWVQAAAGALLIIVGLSVLWVALDARKIRSVRSVEWIDESTGKARSVPLLWERSLQFGRMVSVPDNVQAELELAEGSAVTCSPGTSLAVHITDQRKIQLDSGRIAVRAAHIPNSTLCVETPLGDVEVLGTVFWVEVVRRRGEGEQ
ncbi:MAG: FecR family protein [bacterium]